VEQLPVCNKITLGGAPRARLRLAKSLSLVGKTNPFACAYSQMSSSGVLPNPTDWTCTDPGKRSDRLWTSRGGRFSSTRSFKDGDPFRDAGEELVDGLEVFLFEVGEVSEDLLLGHAGGEVGGQIVDAEAEAADAGLPAHLAGFDGDSWV